MIDLLTCEHPKSESDFSDKHLSTIKPNSLSVKFRHHDRSKVCKFLAFFVNDKAVCWPTLIKPYVTDTERLTIVSHCYVIFKNRLSRQCLPQTIEHISNKC